MKIIFIVIRTAFISIIVIDIKNMATTVFSIKIQNLDV